MPPSRRDELVDTAIALFARHGFHATGIDRILAEAGVAKMTLYNHFKSKDELILAALRRRDERFRDWLMRAVEGRAEDPRGRLLALFDALGEWFASPDFSGCMFINAAAEYCSENKAILRLSSEHKRLENAYVRGLAVAAGAADPAALADHLCYLIEGAIVMAQIDADPGHAGRARALAKPVIDRALGDR